MLSFHSLGIHYSSSLGSTLKHDKIEFDVESTFAKSFMIENELRQIAGDPKSDNNLFHSVINRLRKLFFPTQANKQLDSTNTSSDEGDDTEFSPIVFDISQIDWLNMKPLDLLKFMQEKVLEMVSSFNKSAQPGVRIEIGRITSIPLLSGQLQAESADITFEKITSLSKNGRHEEAEQLYQKRQQIDIKITQIKTLLGIFNNSLQNGLETWSRPSLIELLAQANIKAHVKPAELNFYPQVSDIEINLTTVADYERETYAFIVTARKKQPKTVGFSSDLKVSKR